MEGRLQTIEKRKAKWGYLFILPNLLGILIFTAGPVIFSLIISFTDWNLMRGFNFIGLENYFNLFEDEVFIKSLINTFYFALLTVPAGIILSLLFAALLNRKMKGIGIYRTVMFIPVVTSMVSVSLVWSMLYDTDFGLINSILNKIGLQSVGWLTNTKISMLSVAIMCIWKGLGYNMTIYLAGLQGIPNQLYEAASIDGATPFKKFMNITLPLLRPTTYFVLIMSTIGALQAFDQIYIMTGGGPADSTNTIVMYLYNNAFRYLKMGYASAMAYILFIIIFFLSAIQYKYSKTWSEE